MIEFKSFGDLENVPQAHVAQINKMFVLVVTFQLKLLKLSFKPKLKLNAIDLSELATNWVVSFLSERIFEANQSHAKCSNMFPDSPTEGSGRSNS